MEMTRKKGKLLMEKHVLVFFCI